ncbi:MAG TPA: MFS transporter, partial [Candidatus Angelobacter sp.]|nr:MFS transporter [Candidatus Angelobacter sp.]
TWMQNIAQGWLVLDLTKSPFWLGLVGFASSIPILLFALIGGVIADRVNKRRMLMATQSAMMIFAFIMAALAYSRHINIGEIILLALGTGIAMSLNTPSYQALVPQLVPREDLTNAIALNSAQFNMSRVIGPTLGGFAMAAYGPAGNFFLNGLSFLAVIIALTQIRYAPNQASSDGHLWDKLKEGFNYVFSHAEMKSLVILTAIGSLLAIPYLTFVPYFAREILHTDARGFGLLMACAGVGAFMGALTMAYLSGVLGSSASITGCGVAFFTSIILFTFSHSFYLSGLLLMATGYSMVMMVATINARLQHLAEDHMRGRVMSIYSTAFLGLPPIGNLIAGTFSHIFSAPHVLAGMSAVALAATLFVTTRKAQR